MLDLSFEELKDDGMVYLGDTWECAFTQLHCNSVIVQCRSKKVKEWEESLALNGENLQY